MFKYRLIHQEELERINKEKGALLSEVKDLKNKLVEREKIVIDFSLGEPKFRKSEERIAYISKVAGFYTDVLENKLKLMINNTHTEMEGTENNRDTDLILKGTVYALREILLWGETLTSEYKGFLVTHNKESSDKPEDKIASLLV